MKRYNRLIIAFAILLSGLALIPQVGLFAEAVSWQRYVGIYETPTPTSTPTATGTPSTSTPTVTGTSTATVTGTPSTSTPTVTGTPSTSTPTVTGTPSTSTPTVTGTLSTSTPTVTGTLSTRTPTVTGTSTATVTGTPSTSTATTTAMPANGDISGTVTASDGNPVANINVTAYRDDGPSFGTATTNASGNYTLANLPAGNYRLYFSDPADSYLGEWYNNTNNWNEATLVTVNAEATTEGIDISLITPNQPEPPQATVEPESGSVWTDPHTGEVTVGLAGRVDVTINKNVSCADGSSPTSVTLLLGDTAYSMSETPAGSGTYSVAISGENLPDNIPWNGLPLTVRAECDGSNEETDIGTLFIDPSGYVTDADTSAPISGATVTLYKDPNRTPDNSGPVDLGTECPTINTRPNNDWFSGDLPSATVDENQEADPNSGQFIPATNPLATDATGFYRWDVIEGCWYVVVEADGYQTKVSPIVGVVEGAEVTDLNFQLSSTSQLIYLPIISRND